MKRKEFWIPSFEIIDNSSIQPLGSKFTSEMEKSYPRHKYAYFGYVGPNDAPCRVCGCYTFLPHLYDGTCRFCMLLSPYFHLIIELGESSSKSYKTAVGFMNEIREKISYSEEPKNVISLYVSDFCKCTVSIRHLILIAGEWKNFKCYVCGNEVKSGIVHDLAYCLERILKIENSTSFFVWEDGEVVFTRKYDAEGCKMPKARNQVIAGDYKGKDIKYNRKKIEISAFMHDIPLNSDTVSTYELIDKATKKDKAGAIRKGLIWGAGGLIAHAALSDGIGIYNVAIQFKDGKSCLIEIDENAYQVLNQTCFRTALTEPEPVPQPQPIPVQQPAPMVSAAPSVPADGSVFCTNCGNRVPAGSKFCNACGTQIVAPSMPMHVQSADVPDAVEQTAQTATSEFEFCGKTFDLAQIYDEANGDSLKMMSKIDSNFTFKELMKRKFAEQQALRKAIDSYVKARKG